MASPCINPPKLNDPSRGLRGIAEIRPQYLFSPAGDLDAPARKRTTAPAPPWKIPSTAY
jgi:hypothetical protein